MGVIEMVVQQIRWCRLRGARRVAGLKSPRYLGASISLRTNRGSRSNDYIKIGEQCWIEDGVHLHSWGGRIALGDYVFLGPHVVIYGHGGVKIGKGALISMHCRILSSEHEIPPLGEYISSREDIIKPTCIGPDVWLGAGATVLGGVNIGEGAVVGAGAVVTHDLPPGTIAVGVPARSIGTRPQGTSARHYEIGAPAD